MRTPIMAANVWEIARKCVFSHTLTACRRKAAAAPPVDKPMTTHGFSRRKTRSFAIQKTAFCNAKDHVLKLKEHPMRMIANMMSHETRTDRLKLQKDKKLQFSPARYAASAKGTLIAIAVCLLATIVAQADSGHLYTTDKLTSSLVSCISQDKYGYIWVGTENGLSKFDGYRFTNYHKSNAEKADSTSLISNDITKIFIDSEGRMWIGSGEGLMTYDAENDSFRNYPFPNGCRPRIQDILQNGNGDIIIGTAGYGMFQIKNGTQKVTICDFEGWKSNYGFTSRLFKDRRGDIWFSNHLSQIAKIGTGDRHVGIKEYESECGSVVNFIDTGTDGLVIVCLYGIMKYDYATEKLSMADYDMSLLNRNVSIRKALADHKGNIYIGTSGKGLMVIPCGSNTLQRVETKDKTFDLSTSNVNDIFEDKNDNIWISCYKRGIYLLNQESEVFSSWNFTAQRYFLGSGLSSISNGKESDILAIVQKAGVYRFDKQGKIIAHPESPYGASTIYKDKGGSFWLSSENGLYAYDPYSGAYTLKAKFDGYDINCMTDDGNGRLYICNYGKGLCVYDMQTGKQSAFSMTDRRRNGTICNNWIKALYIDSRGLLWIGSSNGLSCMDTRNNNFNALWQGDMMRDMQSLSFRETRNGDILIGTNNGLYIYGRETKKFSLFPGAEDIRDRSIYSIVIDTRDDIWLSTSRGILLYDKKKKNFISYVSGNGLSNHEYVLGAAIHSADDRIAFGTNDGITVFYPEQVKNSSIEMDNVYLTNFIVNGMPKFSFKDEFKVPYNSNTLQLEFSLLNFKHAEEIKFQYRINDSKEWITVRDGSNAIQFNELKPGKYEIYVRAECNGKYSKQTRKITITVQDPWYSSTLAWIFYCIAIGTVITYALWQYEKNKREELEEAKMRFLINATHDIRSPLTLIIGPLNKLKQRITDKESLADIDTIDRNAQRLLLLVNQILDERRIDKNQMHLHCQYTNLTAQVNGVTAMFLSNARQHGIKLSVESQGDVYGWVDRTNFDKVIQNLLSNSFKFTPDGGEICITLRQSGETITIEVKDSGTGFKEENTEKLFDRFYQGRNSTGSRSAGTGIGLNLCRTLIQMHGGKIKATNRNDGRQGALMTITLRTGNSHLKPEEIVDGEEAAKKPHSDTAKHHASKNYRILVVDDDPEILEYIKGELGEWYKLDGVSNGKEALQALLATHYDLVVSDIVMPVMDGISLLKNIKTNSLVSDIPVILLTSKVDAADRLEGFKKGADAYLPKPFDIKELRIMIDNLVNRVRQLKGKFSGAQAQDDKVEQIKVKGNNDALMERIMKSINKNLSNPDFNVEELTEDVGISRAQLHRKMKEITGISTGEFIRNLRLKQAARLIRENKINITQVAYNVGFNNQTHFSTVFKKHFGMSPSEYAEKNRNVKEPAEEKDGTGNKQDDNQETNE